MKDVTVIGSPFRKNVVVVLDEQAKGRSTISGGSSGGGGVASGLAWSHQSVDFASTTDHRMWLTRKQVARTNDRHVTNSRQRRRRGFLARDVFMLPPFGGGAIVLFPMDGRLLLFDVETEAFLHSMLSCC